MKILHIGLGKAGSTAIQKIVLPYISNIKKIDYLNIYDFINYKNVKFHPLENELDFHKKLPKKFIISNEGLFSKHWNFERIEESFNLIKLNFDKNTKILIVIREPYEYLNSFFCQRVGRLIRVTKKNFFINRKEKINKNLYLRNNDKLLKCSALYRHFNLYYLNYSKLINIYKSYFNHVVVVKYEDLKNLEFLDKITKLDRKDKKYLINEMNNKVYHQSINSFGIKTILFFQRFFNLENFDDVIKEKLRVKNITFFQKIRNKIIAKFLIENFFRKKINKFISYQKYYIEKKFIPIDLNKLKNEYDKIKT